MKFLKLLLDLVKNDKDVKKAIKYGLISCILIFVIGFAIFSGVAIFRSSQGEKVNFFGFKIPGTKGSIDNQRLDSVNVKEAIVETKKPIASPSDKKKAKPKKEPLLKKEQNNVNGDNIQIDGPVNHVGPINNNYERPARHFTDEWLEQVYLRNPRKLPISVLIKNSSAESLNFAHELMNGLSKEGFIIKNILNATDNYPRFGQEDHQTDSIYYISIYPQKP